MAKLNWRAWNAEAKNTGMQQLRKVQQQPLTGKDQKAMMAAQAKAPGRWGRSPHSSN